jgi:hypothetical protein
MIKIAQIAASFVLIAALTVIFAPGINHWMSARASKTGAVSDAEASPGDTGLSIPFLASLDTAAKFGFSGTKTITGQAGSYALSFACAVDGDDYAVQTISEGHTYRQLYVDGQYMLIDDTAKTIRKGILEFAFPDPQLKNAIKGKLIRSTGEIINGTQVTRTDLYFDGTVYAYYFNQKGELIRYYYIYDGNEVTLDFTQFMIGGAGSASFDAPTAYSVR